MFSKIGRYKPCGIFTKGHFILIGLTISAVICALKHSISKSKDEVYKIIKRITVIMCMLEVIRITYSISQNLLYNVNTYLPLYYCMQDY